MLTFALRSMLRDRVRFAITIAGVSLAVLLIVVMQGLFVAGSRQITSYIDKSDADLWVAQSGVHNVHMATSIVPEHLSAQIASVDGVAAVEPIVYFGGLLQWQGTDDIVYAVGIDPDAPMGSPWSMTEGKWFPGPGEVVVSDRLRRSESPALGDKIKLNGRDFVVAGLSKETRTLASTLIFLNRADAESMRGRGLASYVLVRVTAGASPEAVGAEIAKRVQGVEVMTRKALSESDFHIGMDMGVDLLRVMAAVGFLTGIAVVTLTIYSATVEQIRQYALLKAVGAGPGQLLAAIVGQGTVSAAAGFVAGIGLTLAVQWVVPRVVPGLEIDVDPMYAVQLLGLVILMGVAAAVPSYRRVTRVDPMDVFRG